MRSTSALPAPAQPHGSGMRSDAGMTCFEAEYAFDAEYVPVAVLYAAAGRRFPASGCGRAAVDLQGRAITRAC
ncbi:hypothetical protein XFF6990_310158 [Xanthomonas citri pv. fuscans]|nr:hypothetical protein XFF6990_310158 [Xanthomonas citri pv. fuscans]